MWYKLMRVWPVVRCTMICATVCFCFANIPDVPQPPNPSSQMETNLRSVEGCLKKLGTDLRRHEMALVRIVESRPEFLPVLSELYDVVQMNEKGEVTVCDYPEAVNESPILFQVSAHVAKTD